MTELLDAATVCDGYGELTRADLLVIATWWLTEQFRDELQISVGESARLISDLARFAAVQLSGQSETEDSPQFH